MATVGFVSYTLQKNKSKWSGFFASPYTSDMKYGGIVHSAFSILFKMKSKMPSGRYRIICELETLWVKRRVLYMVGCVVQRHSIGLWPMCFRCPAFHL